MAADDYEVIAYKILTYLYGVMKGKIVFDKVVFKTTILKKEISDEYFARILKMMKDENLVSGIVITKVWGNEYIVTSDIVDMEITATGIRYLKENSTIRKALENVPGYISTLIGLVGIV